MPKTPDEIKKGLECCTSRDCGGSKCPYFNAKPCNAANSADALALIQQLQDENAEKDQRIQQLEAERDAAVHDLKCNWKCASCKSFTKPVTKCPHFHECGLAYIHWQWRGVQKEEDK